MKAKLFEKNTNSGQNKENVGAFMNTDCRILPSNEVKFSKLSADADVNLMIGK